MLQSMVLKWFGNLRECCFTLWHGEHSDSCCLSSKPQQGTDSIPPQPKLTLQAWVQLHSFPLSLNSCSLSLDWLPFSVEDRWKFLEHVSVRVKLPQLQRRMVSHQSLHWALNYFLGCVFDGVSCMLSVAACTTVLPQWPIIDKSVSFHVGMAIRSWSQTVWSIRIIYLWAYQFLLSMAGRLFFFLTVKSVLII